MNNIIETEKKIDHVTICINCRYFIKIQQYIVYGENLFVKYKCNCRKKYYKSEISKYINYFTHLYSFTLKTKDTLKLSINNKIIEFQLNNVNNNYYFCKCRNTPIQYCHHCKKFICQKCKPKHYYHKLFNYDQNEFLNNTNLEKLQQYVQLSYKKLSDCNKLARIILKRKSESKNRKLYNYIEYNDKMNELLYTMFELLMNNFKILKNVKNYINLSFFAYCNKPFDFEQYIKKRCLQEDVVNSYIHYCQSNFLISVHSNLKYLSLIKELKFNKWQRKFTPEELLKRGHCLKRYKKFEKLRINKEKKYFEGEQYIINRVNSLLPSEILLLKDNRLLVYFLATKDIYIYGIEGNGWKYQPDIIIYMEHLFNHIIQLHNGFLLYIERNGTVFIIQLFEKTYKIRQKLFTSNCFALQLKNHKILMFGNQGIGINIFKRNRLKLIKKNSDIGIFSFAHELQDGKLLIYRFDEIYFLLKDCETIVASLQSLSFVRHYIHDLAEDAEKHLIYFQSDEYLSIISTKTFEIQSIYKNGVMLVDPLQGVLDSNTKPLLSFMEKRHFNIFKMSMLMMLGCWKILWFFQISKDKILVYCKNNLYIYQIS